MLYKIKELYSKIAEPTVITTTKAKFSLVEEGNQYWYRNGVLHNEDGPAIIQADGRKEWWINGVRHREDGPAVERPNGTQYWFYCGQVHRVDGPAVIYADGTKKWLIKNLLHREDGPAIEWDNGVHQWFLNDKHMSQMDHYHRSPYWRTLSKDEQMYYLLNIGDK